MYVTSREVKNTKYVANFHTKAAADEFEDYLKTFIGVDREMVGVARIRNSVVYTMECFKKGYTLAKAFEDDYISRMKPPVVAQPEPEPVVLEPAIQPEPEPEAIVEEPIVDTLTIEEPVITAFEEESEADTSVMVDASTLFSNDSEVTTSDETATPEQDEEQKPLAFGNKLTGFFKGNNKFNNN